MEYDSGEITSVALCASAGGVDVYLSSPTIQLEPAYIGLCRFVIVHDVFFGSGYCTVVQKSSDIEELAGLAELTRLVASSGSRTGHTISTNGHYLSWLLRFLLYVDAGLGRLRVATRNRPHAGIVSIGALYYIRRTGVPRLTSSKTNNVLQRFASLGAKTHPVRVWSRILSVFIRNQNNTIRLKSGKQEYQNRQLTFYYSIAHLDPTIKTI